VYNNVLISTPVVSFRSKCNCYGTCCRRWNNNSDQR